jgi:hypothetical protein
MVSEIGSGQDQAGDAVGAFGFVAVDEQADRDVEQLHVAQKRTFVNGEDFPDGLRFDENTALHQEIKAERLIADKGFVGDRNQLPVGEGKGVSARAHG